MELQEKRDRATRGTEAMMRKRQVTATIEERFVDESGREHTRAQRRKRPFGRGAVLVIGDAVTNLDGLQVLPEKYCADLPLLLSSLRALRPLQFEIACFAHGLPVVGRARQKLSEIV